MCLGRLMYNNLLDEGSWNKKTTPKVEDAEKIYLALATPLMTNMSSLTHNGSKSGTIRPRDTSGKWSIHLPWRFENFDKKSTKEVSGSIMSWCTNNFHENPMWCGRKNCLGREYFFKAWKKMKEGNKAISEGGTSSSDFNIFLSDVTSPNNFAVLQV